MTATLPAAASVGGDPRTRLDLRLVPVAIAVWGAAVVGLLTPVPAGVILMAGVSVVAATGLLRGHRHALTVAVLALCVVAGVLIGMSRAAPLRDGPVAELAAQGAHVTIEGVLSTDPDVRGEAGHAGAGGGEAGGTEAGPRGRYVVGRLRVEEITGRGQRHLLRSAVLVVARDLAWAELLPGQRVRASGLLDEADGPDLAAVFRPDAAPQSRDGPGLIARATEPMRAGLREAVSGVPGGAQDLVPALVVGDESLMAEQVRADMQATGLTHLTAVSGTNVTIVLVMVLGLARWAGIRSYALPVLAALGVAGFVLLARPDPSVVRAAVMGVVGVVGLTVAGRRRGLPALAAAVVVLIVVDPWLALRPGFAMSVLATAGIIVLAPAWQRAMSWLPAPLAMAVAVPLAAQVACTPIVVAISGQASLASLPANMLAAPAVAPATVLGVAAAVVSPVSPVLAAVLGHAAGLPAEWIVRVARWFAEQPGAVAEWPGGIGGVALATAVAALAVLMIPRLLRRRAASVALALVLVLALVRAPTPGWPPRAWLVVACDVGQGDAVVLSAGEGSAVVVDAGPEPRAVQRCLDSLGITRVPLLVLSHFHADHVGGLAGVLSGRAVERALVSPLAEPAPGADAVRRTLAAASIPVTAATAGLRITVGEALDLRVVWPRRLIVSGESAANNASVVLDARIDETDVLLTGDLEPDAQAALLRAEPGLAPDILKVAHHGSPHQHDELAAGLGAQVALISVGDNDYGHPSDRVVDALRGAGVAVRRTDEDASVAVVRLGRSGLGIVTGGPRASPRS